MIPATTGVLLAALLVAALPAASRRLKLSRAKHPSLAGHGRIARRLARLLPYVGYDDQYALAADGAPTEVVDQRRRGLSLVSRQLASEGTKSAELGAQLETAVSDLQFTNAYRVPFQFRELAQKHLEVGSFADASDGVRLRDPDGRWYYDLGGSYGVNLLGYDFYRECIERGAERVRELGPVLGPYHPILVENVALLRDISGLDEVSFHMSGTEAVMQAVRLARYHTRRNRLVIFTGAYHGWWDGVQPGVGNPRTPGDVFVLKEGSEDTLKVLRGRRDVACVLVNPLQALAPNRAAASDATLIASERSAGFDREAYTAWLQQLRQVCSARGIVLIFDEVFVGFRLAPKGAQEYFGVSADLVTYGKTVGGGLPIGVVCGRRDLMKRYRDDRPSDICFARGTFNSHPYVMASMNEFLRHATSEEFTKAAREADALWNARAQALNERLAGENLPIRVRNLVSIWTLTYEQPSRYNWMLQYYLRSEGLALAWIGTGRFIFSHNFNDEAVREVGDRIVRAALRMRDDGWWWQDATLTNRSIRRQVLRELLRARLGRLSGPARPLSAPRRRDRDERGTWGRSTRPS